MTNPTANPTVKDFLTVSLSITIETALSIGAGGSSGGFADKTVVRDAKNRLIIPGSHLKGRVRHACEAIARAAGYAVCNGPVAGGLCPTIGLKGPGLAKVISSAGLEVSGQFCIICQLFGAPSLPAAIHFNDLLLEENTSNDEPSQRLGIHGLTALRPGVSINRKRRVAEGQRLYFTETSRPGSLSHFSSAEAIQLNLPTTINGPQAGEYYQLLVAGLKYNRQWGGGKTRGMGWASLDFKFQFEGELNETTRHQLTKIEPVENFQPSQKKQLQVAKIEGAKELLITLEAISPLSLSERRPKEQFRHSQPFVPGSMLRGALAMQLKRRDPVLFTEIFDELQGQLGNYFGHAMPAGGQREYQAGFVAPFTTRVCKEQKEHGFFDTLIDQLAYERRLSEDRQNQVGPVYLPRCPMAGNGCSGRVEALGGLLRFNQTSGEYEAQELPEERMLTRVAINRRRAAAEESMLYSPLVLNEGTVFQARLRLHSDEQALRLADFLIKHNELHLGSGISRGLGRAKIIEVKMITSEAEIGGQLETRVARFNQELRQRFQQGWGLQIEEDLLYFTLSARSELILAADPSGWGNGPFLTKTLLSKVLANNAQLVEVRSFAATTQRSSWNSTWGLMRETQLMASAGSVYAVAFRLLGQSHTGLYQRLAELEQTGLGTGQYQGYGTIRICDPVHYNKLWKEK
jgi:CRISPR-associated protein Csx10